MGKDNVMVTSLGDSRTHELAGRTGVFWTHEDIRLRKFDQGVDLGRIRQAIKDDHMDEVVFRTPAGDRYAIYAYQLCGKVNAGDTVEVDGIRGTVEMVDKHWNKKTLAAAGIVVAGVGGILVGAEIGIAAGAAAAAAAAGTSASPAGVFLGGVFGAAIGVSARAL